MVACLAPKRTTLRRMTDKEKEAHLWLHDRIDELQEEQSSNWQKLSQFFFGKPSW